MTHQAPANECEFQAFVEREEARRTNFVTVVGGEPILALDRTRRIYDDFWMNVASNGLIPFPTSGFENKPIGVAVWGDRAFWYYTVAPGHAPYLCQVVSTGRLNGDRWGYDVSTRRCCTGVDRDCSSCFDVWEHFSWIIGNTSPGSC